MPNSGVYHRYNLNLPELSAETLMRLSGPNQQHIHRIEDALDIDIMGQAGKWHIEGRQAEFGAQALRALASLACTISPSKADVEQILRTLRHKKSDKKTASQKIIALKAGRRNVQGKTPNQCAYIRHMQENTLTVAVGPAGCGKTYLAVAAAVVALTTEQVERIILTRPAVEAGEKLGFLPGDLQQKVDPYLRPLFDALTDMLGIEKMNALMEQNRIEIAPLAYMRGRTLNDAFVILDEAQNTTQSQMKMFLTRLGFSSKMVVTGDITQVDLPHANQSGLLHALHVLKGIKDIGISHLTAQDVVRHQLVESIVKAYESYA
ncbi:MAG: PhoH family protein [Mariprofundaceae bacterium]|nr:PhoH family protein [Mariprofundaceae bacterium]